jgi:hypothetical protein
MHHRHIHSFIHFTATFKHPLLCNKSLHPVQTATGLIYFHMMFLYLCKRTNKMHDSRLVYLAAVFQDSVAYPFCHSQSEMIHEQMCSSHSLQVTYYLCYLQLMCGFKPQTTETQAHVCTIFFSSLIHIIHTELVSTSQTTHCASN